MRKMKVSMLVLILMCLYTTALSQKTKELNREVNALKEQQQIHGQKIQGLQSLIDDNAKNLTETSNELVTYKELAEVNNKQVEELNNSINRLSLFLIVGFILVILFSFFLYLKINKEVKKNKSALLEHIRKVTDLLRIDMSNHINKTADLLRESQFRSDDELIKLLQTQMMLMKEEKEIDSKLVSKIITELNRIRKNLNQLNPELKGFNELNEGILKIQDDLKTWL